MSKEELRKKSCMSDNVETDTKLQSLHIIKEHEVDESSCSDEASSKVWYEKGLRFSCTQCGKCCTGKPGYVWLDDEDLDQILTYLNITIDEFANKYLRLVDGRIALRERGVNYDCVFLKGKQCQIYPVRPKQCKTFPWWPQILESRENWEKTAIYCEGIREDATFIAYEEIEKVLEEKK
jgi:uncharacterized protein